MTKSDITTAFFCLRIWSNVLLWCGKIHTATKVFRLSFSVVHCTESRRERRISAAVRDTIPQPSMMQHFRLVCTSDFVTVSFGWLHQRRCFHRACGKYGGENNCLQSTGDKTCGKRNAS